MLWGCSKVLLTKINPLKYVNHHLSIFAPVLKQIFYICSLLSHTVYAARQNSEAVNSMDQCMQRMFVYIHKFVSWHELCFSTIIMCKSPALARGLFSHSPEQRHQQRGRTELGGCSQRGGWREHRTTPVLCAAHRHFYSLEFIVGTSLAR